VLTAEGRRRLVAAAPTHVAGVRAHLFDQLTPDQVRDLARGLGAVADGLGVPAPQAARP
jgi:hypothetical protein